MNFDIRKVMRAFLVVMMFIPLLNIIGMDLRVAQQTAFTLFGIGLFSLLIGNLWIMLFALWTLFLFCFFKFSGDIYISNIFAGIIVYYVCKVAFKRENSNIVINALLWVCFANVALMILQTLGLDPVFRARITTPNGTYYSDMTEVAGFMGFPACMGVLMALCVPVLASRPHKFAPWVASGLFLPLYLAKSSICVLGGIVGLLFILFFKLSRKVWFSLVAGLIILGTLYVVKVDAPMGTLDTRIYQWRDSVRDCIIHPVTGWGLDSFRNITDTKKHIYCRDYQVIDGKQSIAVWDNAHSLPVQVMFEFGLVGLIILIGLMREYILRFRRAIKSPDVMATFGFLLVVMVVSLAQFPMYLARTVVLIIPMAAMFEVLTQRETT